MSLDTAYRPISYDDVLGQESTVRILRQYVSSGAGFHQSYLFAGPWGSGKTTLARILARALLCEKPVGGSPCDSCISCQNILRGGSSENFFEIDAATNSGKDSVRKIVEETQYSTFSGKRRINLMDESHRLSADALDALLKPLEDCVPGGTDKRLVCLFCTTEPEKMRTTILSRCAPAFVIKPVPPEVIAERLAWICQKEGIQYDLNALVLISEITECHIRDALKAIEGVSMLGAVTLENASKYLHLDYSSKVQEILTNLSSDLPKSLKVAEELLKSMSPITLYEKLADMAILAYRVGLGSLAPPKYLDQESLSKLGTALGPLLLTYADKFSTRPGRPTSSMLLCDLAYLNLGSLAQPFLMAPPAPSKILPKETQVLGSVEEAPKVVDGVYVNSRAVNRDVQTTPTPKPTVPPPGLLPQEFFSLVKRRVTELTREEAISGGQERRSDLGDTRIDPSG